MMKTNETVPHASGEKNRGLGFSLLELMIAITVFLIVGGAAVSLVRRHAPLFGGQQGQVQLNLTLRNVATQLQNDVENAGSGYYQGVDIPAFPVGVTIANNVPGATSCYDPATHTYGPACFDTLNVIVVDHGTPPAHPMNIPATSCTAVTDSSLFVQPADPLVNLSTLAADFNKDDNILVLSGDGTTMVSLGITDPGGGVSDGKVKLPHNPTGASYSDPFGINTDLGTNNKIMTQMCNDAWVLRLAGIKYSVDASDPTNPKLMRNNDIVAEQIIGFKVGAAVDVPGLTGYQYDSTKYKSDWTTVRAVRISVIARSNPTGDSNSHNTFDGGNYKVEAISIVVNPRNLSMNQ